MNPNEYVKLNDEQKASYHATKFASRCGKSSLEYFLLILLVIVGVVGVIIIFWDEIAR